VRDPRTIEDLDPLVFLSAIVFTPRAEAIQGEPRLRLILDFAVNRQDLDNVPTAVGAFYGMLTGAMACELQISLRDYRPGASAKQRREIMAKGRLPAGAKHEGQAISK
jgi:hypothetical protein